MEIIMIKFEQKMNESSFVLLQNIRDKHIKMNFANLWIYLKYNIFFWRKYRGRVWQKIETNLITFLSIKFDIKSIYIFVN